MKLSRYVLRYDTEDGSVYFNTKNNHSFLITNELKKNIQENKTTGSEYIAYLEENRYLREDNEVNKYLKQIEDRNNEILEFTILTHGDCNFRCKYCYEHFKNIGMSIETENAILKFAEEKLSNSQYHFLRIAWFGGEPLLGYKTIQRLSLEFLKICERFGITYSASITTNGFLLTSSKFEKLVREYDVTNFQITIDGDGESHDSQRVLKNQKGSYARILDNLHKMKDSDLDFICTLRFNISKENYDHMESFLLNDGRYFKNDDRFFLLYHNIGNWGQGDRSKDDCVTVFKNDMSFGISKKAVDLGYHLSLPSIVVHNSFSCYANRSNHYMFNVRGIVQACTVALYDNQNVFGNINTGLINKDKMKGWFLSVREDCKTCPFVLICKSGFCPMAKYITELSSSVICKNMQEKIRKNLALYAISGCYEDILDVD